MPDITRFYLLRRRDRSGISDTGRVLEGVIFQNGKIAICWNSLTPSIAIYDSLQDFTAIHVDPHPAGDNEIIFLD